MENGLGQPEQTFRVFSRDIYDAKKHRKNILQFISGQVFFTYIDRTNRLRIIFDDFHIVKALKSTKNYLKKQISERKLSCTQIQDTDSYSDTDSTKQDFDLSNQRFNDY